MRVSLSFFLPPTRTAHRLLPVPCTEQSLSFFLPPTRTEPTGCCRTACTVSLTSPSSGPHAFTHGARGKISSYSDFNGTDGMSSLGGGNASDIGLVVQGVLIFLASVVGVFGFIVKGRIERKAKQREDELQYEQHLRRLNLERIRLQISAFIGPACQHSMALWSQFWTSTVAGNQETTFDKLSHGLVSEYYTSVNFSFQTFMNGQINGMSSWVGPKCEQSMRDDPKSLLSVTYRNILTRLVRRSAVPLSALIEMHGQVLSQFPTTDEFKKRWPCSASDGWLRNSYYNSFVNWTHEFLDIIHAWEREDYRLLFPQDALYPAQLTPYLITQLTKLRKKETDLGSADHKVTSDDEFDKSYKTTEYVKKK